MKKLLSVLLAAGMALLTLAGCSREAGKTFPSDEEIMENMTPYLEDAVLQDPAAYPSMEDFLMANLGLSESDVEDAVLYMGAANPANQNTTFFLMVTKTEGCDTKAVKEKLDARLKSQVSTAEMGYLTGSTEYAVIEKGEKIFAIMHEDQNKFAEMKKYIDSL